MRLSKQAVLEVLAAHPAFRLEHELRVKVLEPSIYVTWHARDYGRTPSQGSHLDLQLIGETCYVLGVGLAPEYRGLGQGAQLYLAAEAIAKRAGCRRICMTPSGWTVRGETRADYVVRKLGYRLVDGEAVKELREANDELERRSQGGGGVAPQGDQG